ncbi:MAG: hypothetical protein LBR07_07845 [Puniceicoccales bacterium]|nr:hypothetical protein [Puniceicoccales bacterium]
MDSTVLVPRSLPAGTFADVTITAADGYDLVAEAAA